ncbi:MAG: lysine 2-monooxygenase [Thermoanaerobaculia bacterium]|nr:lysine 2-monooxygenase [Thermoanaerobaculia bacterium]
MPEPKKIAIVGGGIAGLYTAWRLVTAGHADGSDRPFQVTLFESSKRLGGRILSQILPPLPFRAELGAMRFHPMTHHLLRALIDDLKIPTRPFDVSSPHLYVRGRALSPQEILDGYCLRCRAGVPFLLRHDERGRAPEDLIRWVMKSLFNDLSFPNAEPAKAHEMKERLIEGNYGADVWDFLRRFAMFENIPLREIGFWNLLQHYLSNEAHQLLYHSLSLESVIGNWNAAEAIPWFVSDFTGSDLWMVPGGMSRIVERMEADLIRAGCKPLVTTPVSRCQKREQNGPWTVTSKDVNDSEFNADFDTVIFAVPRSSYEDIKIFNGEDEWSPPWLKEIESHRLFKVFLLYENPWWVGDDVPGAQTGRTYTDLPLRQVYYFHPDWIQKCAESAAKEWEVPWSGEFKQLLEKWKNNDNPKDGTRRRWSLVMASYSDEHHVNFWRPPSGRILDEGAVHFKSPEGMPYHDAQLLESEIANQVDDRLRVRVRTVRKIQQQLREIHGQSVEEPIAGIYKDWGTPGETFGGGWHTWLVGADVDSFYADQDRKGLYFCGEVFSRDQGWIEGALKTAELVLARLDVAPLDRARHYCDLDFNTYIGNQNKDKP